MKKIFQLTSILAVLSLVVLSCTKETLSTDQYDSNVVALKAYGPQPVVRGGVLRFVGSNLDKVATVTIPGVDPIVPEVITSGEHSEIRVTVPKDGPAPGYPVLTLADGTTLTGQTQITYSEPITIEEFAPAALYPGETLTVKGDYLNLIHEIVFNNKVIVSEDKFTSHTRYEIKVVVPEEAQTGKFALGTVDETKVNADDAEGKALLATLNLIESATPLTVGTATASFPTAAIKGGNDVTFNGSHLLLVDEMYIDGDYEVQEFDASDSQITFYLSEMAPDGVVELVMASGVRVAIGTLTTVTPSELAVSPKPVKAGAEMKVTGKDLDLVDNIAVGGAGISDFTCNEEGTEIVLTVPELAVEGDVLLIMVNRKEVTVPFTLVKPTFTAYGANPASAGSDVDITGKDLDLVAKVAFAVGQEGEEVIYSDPIKVEATETLITVAVPTAAVKGKVKLILKNGTEVFIEEELDVDKPVAAYLVTVPTQIFKVGDLFLADIENVEHLQKVLFDEIEVQYVVNNGQLYATVPAGVKKGTILHLVSDNGTLDYAVNIDPGDRIVTTIWSGSSTVTWGGGAVTALSWGGYDWSTVKPGTVLGVTYTIDNPGGCIRFGNGSWASIPSLAGLAPDGNLPLQEGGHKVVLTEEDVNFLVNNGGFVLCGDGYTVTSIDLIELIPQETVIWSGSSTVTWGGGAVTALSWGGYDWSTVVPGTGIIAHYTIDDPSGVIRFGNGSWASIPSAIPFGDADGNISLPEGSTSYTVTLDEADVAFLVNNGGFVLCGTGYTVTAIGLLIMPEP